MVDRPSLTELIRGAQRGEQQAFRELFDVAYADLHRMARSRLRLNERGTLLDTTSLVHESFLRFSKAGQLNIEDRAHFFRYAGQVMRSVIVDLARARAAERRGGDVDHVTLNTAIGDATGAGEDEILRVHEALEEINQYDERIVRVVELRYFAGLSDAEIATILGVTDRTVRRDWDKARLLLAQNLR